MKTALATVSFLLLAPAAFSQTGGAGSPDIPDVASPRKASSPTGSTVDLRQRFEPGRVSRYVLDMRSDSRVRVTGKGGKESEGQQTLEQLYELRLVEVSSDQKGAVLELIYDRAKIAVKGDGFNASFDTAPPRDGHGAAPADPAGADPAAEEMNGVIERLVGGCVGTKITVHTDSDGRITSVTGGEALPGAGGVAGIGMGAMGPDPKAIANWVVSGPAGGTAAPERAARIGEPWTIRDTLAGTPVGGFTMTTTHTLRSVSGGIAEVAFRGGLEPASQAPSAGAQVKDASFEGTYMWDTRLGLLKGMAADLTASIDPGNGGAGARWQVSRVVSTATRTHISVRRQ